MCDLPNNSEIVDFCAGTRPCPSVVSLTTTFFFRVLSHHQSLGDGPQKKALSRRFRSYSWIFTDALIDKLVALRTEDSARSRVLDVESNAADSLLSDRAQAGDSSLKLERESRKGEACAESGPRRLELKRERRRCKSDVMREMTAGCGSSKDLLVKIVGSWLPEVLAADRLVEV